MFIYIKTNILRGSGIFKIDFSVFTDQLMCYLVLLSTNKEDIVDNDVRIGDHR